MNFTQFPTEIVRNIASYLVEVRYYKGKYCGQVSKKKQAILENTLLKHPIIYTKLFDSEVVHVKLYNETKLSHNYYSLSYVLCNNKYKFGVINFKYNYNFTNVGNVWVGDTNTWVLKTKTNKWEEENLYH